MKDHMCSEDLRTMLSEAAKQIRDQQEMLSQLDSFGGDGDHGAAMAAAADQIQQVSAGCDGAAISSIFRQAGSQVLSIDGGASTALLGTFLGAMADVPCCNSDMDCQLVAKCFRSGLDALSKYTKARPGDKTMLDALVPAVDALEEAARSGKSIPDAFAAAEMGARVGSASTTDMVARYGRAKFLGERTRGHPDAGATSIALLFRGFRDALRSQEEV
jgi:dihydroxyacetone kinase-like protein